MKINNFKKTLSNFIFSFICVLTLMLASAFLLSKIDNKISIVISVIIVLAVLFGMIFQIRFRKKPPSEDDIRDLQNQMEKLNNELDFEKNNNIKLKDELKKGKIDIINLDWLWEVNIAGIDYGKKKIFDYYKPRDENRYFLWEDSNETKKRSNDRRLIGVFDTKYRVKAGIDLRDLMIRVEKDHIVCSNPTIKITGVTNISSKWDIKIELRCSKPFGMVNWELVGPDNPTYSMDTEFWEKEMKDSFENATNTDIIDENLKEIIDQEIKGRLSNLLNTLTGLSVKYESLPMFKKKLLLSEYLSQIRSNIISQ